MITAQIQITRPDLEILMMMVTTFNEHAQDCETCNQHMDLSMSFLSRMMIQVNQQQPTWVATVTDEEMSEMIDREISKGTH